MFPFFFFYYSPVALIDDEMHCDVSVKSSCHSSEKMLLWVYLVIYLFIHSFIFLVLVHQVATPIEHPTASLEGKHEKKGGIAAPLRSH